MSGSKSLLWPQDKMHWSQSTLRYATCSGIDLDFSQLPYARKYHILEYIDKKSNSHQRRTSNFIAREHFYDTIQVFDTWDNIDIHWIYGDDQDLYVPVKFISTFTTKYFINASHFLSLINENSMLTHEPPTKGQRNKVKHTSVSIL